MPTSIPSPILDSPVCLVSRPQNQSIFATPRLRLRANERCYDSGGRGKILTSQLPPMAVGYETHGSRERATMPVASPWLPAFGRTPLPTAAAAAAAVERERERERERGEAEERTRASRNPQASRWAVRCEGLENGLRPILRANWPSRTLAATG
uniref:Uncharacterized protein n=1 Tax=Oryza sativa subsp. japonica TaxID=39947 RepID=Q6YV38_ORYSJ|nr:hypothetical protein [Oryza sativa Japonica Group]BAD08091.1 hypothetical protein [Oryza sativa Japonica Group]